MRRPTANTKLRQKADAAGVSHWEIALELGVCEMTITRWLRTELDPERAERISAAIDRVEEKRRTA